MKKLILILVILFVSVSVVSASENADNYTAGDVTNNTMDNVGLVSDDLNQDNGHDGLSDNWDDANASSDDVKNNTNPSVKKPKSKKVIIKGANLVAYYKSKPVYKFKVLNSKGKPASGLKVKLIFNGKSYDKRTNKKGVVSLKLSAKAGKYTIKLKYGKKTVKKKVDLYKLKAVSRNVQSVYGRSAFYKVRVLDNSGRSIKGAAVTFKVTNRVYHKKTNSKGFAILSLNYDAGRYLIRYSVGDLHGKNLYVVKNRITLKILNWGLRGDVSKAPLIKRNIPNNYWVKSAVKATKYGIPLLVIKGGSGKSVFMTAGVHGNELPSQVAIMKMIAYLTDRPVKGTVYIVPFVNVKAINYRVRLTDNDYNRIAHVPGTVSNNIVKLILHYKCDAYGDFHSTERPGIPGENIVLGYKYPVKSCIPLTNFIAKNSNVNKKFYNYAGQVYRWSLADYVNSKGTPAVICEVISLVNTVVPQAVRLSYRMMNQYLVYNRII